MVNSSGAKIGQNSGRKRRAHPRLHVTVIVSAAGLVFLAALRFSFLDLEVLRFAYGIQFAGSPKRYVSAYEKPPSEFLDLKVRSSTYGLPLSAKLGRGNQDLGGYLVAKSSIRFR